MTFFNLISKKSTKKNIIIGLVVIVLINLVVFPYFATETVNVKTILDLQFGFSKKYVENILIHMQEGGRKIYMLTTMLIDTPYAIFYGFIYSLIFASLIKKLDNSINNNNNYLIIIPFFISIFDLIENSGIIFFIYHYNNINPNIVAMISIANQLKWLFAIYTFFMLIYLLIRKKSASNKIYKSLGNKRLN